MKNLTGKILGFSAALFFLLGFLTLANTADAQTKKKRTKRQTTTKQTPQPVQPSTLPIIVSTADQYSDQNRQIITGNVETQTPVEQTQTEPETFEDKLDRMNNRLKEMNTRMKSLEGSKQSAYDQKQKRLLLNLDILTRAEQRAESLRKQLFELVEKENSIKTKLDTIDYDLRPEMIDRQTAFTGSLRPEEIREAKKKSLEAEKTNLSSLLTEISATRANLEQNVQKADQLVEKLRAVLEKDIDDALNEQPEEQIEKPKDQ